VFKQVWLFLELDYNVETPGKKKGYRKVKKKFVGKEIWIAEDETDVP
jgi:hypothetical protein